MLVGHKFHLPKNSGLLLRDQICEVVSAAINAQTIAPGQKLPSCRALAQQLGVSRNTVFSAYGKLVDLEILVAKDRSRFVVNAAWSGTTQPTETHNAPSLPIAHLLPAAKNAPSSLPKIEHPTNWSSYPYPFIYNQADPSMFPLQGWRECMRDAMNVKRLSTWSGDAGGEDSALLIAQLRQRLLGYRGLRVSEDEILITSGAQNALFILGLLFRDAAGDFAVEDPGYPEARTAFVLSGNTVGAAPVDSNGVVPEKIPAGCKVLYCTPSHQFPTGVTLPLERRHQLLDLAQAKGMAIIEDDYEAEMNYRRDRLPPIRALDQGGSVIYTGSLSKTVSPGLRLGFMVAHPEVIREAKLIRRAMLRHPPMILQDAMAHFLAMGHYDAHLRRLHRRLRARWETMKDALDRHIPEYATNGSDGGTCFWLEGSQQPRAGTFQQRLNSRGVLFDDGPVFFSDPSRARGKFRLGFAASPLKAIEPGIKIIAEELDPPR